VSVSYNWWVTEGFFAVGSGLKERGVLVDNRRYFRKRRVKDVTKGVWSVFSEFCSCD